MTNLFFRRYLKLNGLFFLFFFSMAAGIAQNPAYFTIGKKEFANTNIYTLLFDESNELLYVGTNNGLYVYKQNKFRLLKEPEKQIGNSIFSLKQNSIGEIFCKNLNGQIFKIKNDSLSLFYSVPKVEKVQHFKFFFIENDEIFVSTSLYAKVLNKEGIVLKTIFKRKKNKGKEFAINAVSQTKDGTIYVTYYNMDSVYVYKNHQLSAYPVGFRNINAQTQFFKLNNRVLSVCNGGNVNSSIPFVFQNYTPKNKEQILLFDDDELIGLDQKKGIHFLVYKNDTLSEGQHFFDEKHISSFYKRDKGVLFFGSFGDGIYIVPDRKVLVAESTHFFSGMAIINDTLFLSTREGQVFKAENTLKLVDAQNYNIDDIFYVYGDFSFKNIRQKNLIYGVKLSIKDVFQIDSTHLLVASASELRLITSKKNTPIHNLDYSRKKPKHYSIIEGERFWAVTWSPKDSLIYYCSGFGVFSKKWSSPKVSSLLFEAETFLGNDLFFYKNQLVCGTKKNGILFFENNQFSKQLSEKDGLNSNAVKKIQFQEDKLFILTNAGFQIYDLSTKKIIGLGLKEGVFTENVTNFEIHKNKLWLLEKHRYYAIDFNFMAKKEDVAKLHIDSININNHSIDYLTKNAFEYTENQFEFYYDYRDVLSQNETKISYTLEGFYDKWKTASTRRNKIEFQSLPVGHYTFKIKATYRNQATKTFVYSFEILTPYWQRWWFYLAILMGITAFLTVAFNLRLRYQKKKSQLLNEVNTSKLTAIQSQMNPHFIFNALNSIQALVLRGDIDKSYAYINKFSSLVRKTLLFSDKDFVEFESEVQQIATYLSLEKLRFRADFEYTITPPAHDEFLVPPMLIQPFIENALLHGLLHKEGLKTIDISFKVTDVLECVIKDNGIGRAAANEINQRQNPDHESFATTALKNRLAILNRRFGQPIGVDYEDLYENNQAVGTKVLIKIPIKKEF